MPRQSYAVFEKGQPLFPVLLAVAGKRGRLTFRTHVIDTRKMSVTLFAGCNQMIAKLNCGVATKTLCSR